MSITMSAASWLTSLECSTSILQSSDNSSSVSIGINWLRFIFISPCPQRVLFSCNNFLFLFTLLVFAIQKLFSRFIFKVNSRSPVNEPLLKTEKSQVKVDLWFYLSLIATSLLAISYTVLCILAFTRGLRSTWELAEAMFRIAQAITFVVVVVLIAQEKKFEAVGHPMSLRIYWVANFIISVFFAASAITRLISYGGHLDHEMGVDNVLCLASLPIPIFLFVAAIQGLSGISFIREQGLGTFPSKELYEPKWMDPNTGNYGTASWFSKAVWLWMNPLLSKGYKSPLSIDDVPSLPPDYQAEMLGKLFEMNWPKPGENSKNPVRNSLFLCFWKSIVYTGFLSVVKLAVMYVGPLMIQNFVDYTKGKRSSPYEGYYLIITLLMAKTVEALSTHHYKFEARKLAVLVRTSLNAVLYKKSLKLSCSSRQSHGLGQIVNYMSVDSQRVAELMNNFHPIWMMLLQVGAALALIYRSLGPSVLAPIAAVIGVFFFTIWITRKNNLFVYTMMIYQDKRMRETSKMLNNMRVIKFQAWEDHFSKKIQSLRELEYGWLTKFTYSISGNSVMLGGITTVISALTFSVAVLFGVPLNVGIVFTATSLLRILQEPLQAFPEALVSISQAMISLKRLDGYLTSQELDSGSVERDESCEGGEIAVEVKDGTFSWDDEGGEHALKDVNLEIKRGGCCNCWDCWVRKIFLISFDPW